MRFIDSNILAYAFYDNPHRKRCQDIINEGGIVNTVAFIEAYHIISLETTPEYATQAVTSLLKSHLQVVNVDINLIFETLKRTSRHTKLKFIDLLHYVTALLYACTQIASYDKDFDGLDIARVT